MRDTRLLPCPLTERELADRRDRVAGLIEEIVKVEDAKKSAAAAYKLQLDTLGTAARQISRQILTRSEERMVEVTERHDPTRFCVDVWREDTGELLETRPMDDEEIIRAKQLMLPSVTEERRRRKKEEKATTEGLAEGPSK